MKQMGIVDSGDAQTLGIGAMKPERIKDFYDKMVRAGLYKAGDVDLSKVATTQFVNQGVGVDVRKKLTGKLIRGGLAPSEAIPARITTLSCVCVSKSPASWRSCSWLAGSPNTRLTMRPRLTAGPLRDGVGPAHDVRVLLHVAGTRRRSYSSPFTRSPYQGQIAMSAIV